MLKGSLRLRDSPQGRTTGKGSPCLIGEGVVTAHWVAEKKSGAELLRSCWANRKQSSRAQVYRGW